MNKKYLIVLLVAMTCITSCSSFKMSNRAAFHYKEAKLASKIINQLKEDNPNYFYDVLMETDVYQEYIDLIYGKH